VVIAAAEKDNALKALLKGNEAWCEYTREGGPFASLATEQEGDLGGPRPIPPPVIELSQPEIPTPTMEKLRQLVLS
jgi:hypothetical protein